MNTFKPGDTVRPRANAADHLGTYAGHEYIVASHDQSGTAAYPEGDLYVEGSEYAHSAGAFEPVVLATEPPSFAAGLYRDVDGRGWLHDVAGAWHPVHAGGGSSVDPTTIDDGTDGWWDADPDSNTTAMFFDYAERFGLEVRVQVRRAAR